MASLARFEAEQGWVAVSPDGSVWCYRGRASAGVLVFERTGDGPVVYQATHQDCFSVDTSLTSDDRRSAVRFAVAGTTEAPRRAAGRSTLGEAAAASDAAEAQAAGPAHPGSNLAASSEAGGSLHGGPERAPLRADDILAALQHLSSAERSALLARLLELAPSAAPD